MYFRALATLFENAAARKSEIAYSFECSLLEIYNEKIIDLLFNTNFSF